LTDFKYSTASPDKKRHPTREKRGYLGMPWVKRPLEVILMLLLIITGILAMAVVVSTIKIWSLGWETLSL
jgi:hypothetical protein